MRKRLVEVSVTFAALAIAGSLLGGGVAPAFATEGSSKSPVAEAPTAQPKPPSAEARAAALEVLEYVADVPKPALPAVGSPKEAWSEPAAARAGFYEGFPIQAGLAQWDCWLVGDGIDVDFVAESADDPATYGYSFGLGCDGYRPSSEEIFAPRAAALDVADEAGPGAAAPLACQTIAGGQHCITFPGEVQADYIWLGSLMYGRTRLGQANVVWPACNSTGTILASSVHTLHENDGIRLGYIHNQNANWSLTFDQANSAGQITGVRSAFCEAG